MTNKHNQENEDRFDHCIEQIEIEHLEFFQSRKSQYPSSPHDKLIYPFQTWSFSGVKFNEDSDLPQEIRDKVHSCFMKIYGNNSHHE